MFKLFYFSRTNPLAGAEPDCGSNAQYCEPGTCCAVDGMSNGVTCCSSTEHPTGVGCCPIANVKSTLLIKYQKLPALPNLPPHQIPTVYTCFHAYLLPLFCGQIQGTGFLSGIVHIGAKKLYSFLFRLFAARMGKSAAIQATRGSSAIPTQSLECLTYFQFIG